jgi:CheY-like chemotaxis protein
VVLMDVQMPEMDGLTATCLLRQWEQEQGMASTPIIALTASALQEDVDRSLAAGCNAHVNKPVRKRVLLEVIRSVVAANAAAPDAATAPSESLQ